MVSHLAVNAEDVVIRCASSHVFIDQDQTAAHLARTVCQKVAVAKLAFCKLVAGRLQATKIYPGQQLDIKRRVLAAARGRAVGTLLLVQFRCQSTSLCNGYSDIIKYMSFGLLS